MSGGTLGGFCSETSHQFYVNSSDTAAQLDVWVKNNGDCNVVIEIATPDSGFHEPMDGVSVWAPGEDFLQTVEVPPDAHLWFSCADVHLGESVPGPGSNCSFDWELPGIPTIPRLIVTDLAIDPLALVLAGDVYIKLHLPDPGPEERVRSRVRELAQRMSRYEKRAARARLKAIQTYVSAVEQELSEI
jgi:hypothetical protein